MRIEQPDLFSGEAQLHRHPEPTEAEAKEKVDSVVARKRKMVYDAVVEAGPFGMTGYELCQRFQAENPYTIRPRLTELKDKDLIFRPGLKRPNADGNNEMVNVATIFMDEMEEVG